MKVNKTVRRIAFISIVIMACIGSHYLGRLKQKMAQHCFPIWEGYEITSVGRVRTDLDYTRTPLEKGEKKNVSIEDFEFLRGVDLDWFAASDGIVIWHPNGTMFAWSSGNGGSFRIWISDPPKQKDLSSNKGISYLVRKRDGEWRVL